LGHGFTDDGNCAAGNRTVLLIRVGKAFVKLLAGSHMLASTSIRYSEICSACEFTPQAARFR
jgi:hypothetical protein